MDLDAMEALEEHWLDEPPVALSVARFLGVKPRRKGKKRYGDLKELLDMFPDGRVRTN